MKMVQAVGKTSGGTLHTGRCGPYQVQGILGNGVFHVLHWLRINSGGSEGVGVEFKILSLADKIYLFMKMRKKKHTNRRLTKKYCRIRGKITLKSQRNRKYYLFQVKTNFFNIKWLDILHGYRHCG